jgi:hypothetical protein
MKQTDLGVCRVRVDSIIGGDEHAGEDFDDNFKLIVGGGFDLRYENVERYVRGLVKGRMRNKRIAHDLGYIHLFKFDQDYYVCMDGHRRVSVAKKLRLHAILADVTELLPN